MKNVTSLSNILKPKFSQFSSKGANETGGRVLFVYWGLFSFVLGWGEQTNTDLKKHRLKQGFQSQYFPGRLQLSTGSCSLLAFA